MMKVATELADLVYAAHAEPRITTQLFATSRKRIRFRNRANSRNSMTMLITFWMP